MLKSSSKRKISTTILFLFIFQLIQNFYFVKNVYAEVKNKIEIVKEDVIKDKESNTVSFKVKIKNTSDEELVLSKLKLSYWYSNRGIKNEEVLKDWMSVDSSKVNIDIEKLDKNYKNSNSKINIKFSEGLKALKNGEEIELNVRLQNKQWESYNQEESYSFSNDITAEYDESIVYGKIPEEVPKEEPIIKVKAQMYNKQINQDITAIYPWFKIVNSGNFDLDSSKIEVRYYYTVDDDSDIAEDIIIDWANIGKEKVITEIKGIDDSEKSDRYLSIKLNSNDKFPINSDIEIQSRFNKKGWSSYNQMNDYSFNKDATDYVDWDKIVILYNDEIITGEEPEINDGLQLIELEAKRRKNIVSMKWDEVNGATYLLEKSKGDNNFTEVVGDLAANMYIDSLAEDLDSVYDYRVAAFDSQGNKIAKSKKIRLNSFKDSDGDSVSDEEEKELGTDINNIDTDDDGLTDGEEVLIHKTNPLDKDSDKDGLYDNFEVYISNTNPLKGDTDENGILDSEEDLDKDGLTIIEEYNLDTNPKEKDSDFDGINDNEEVYKYKTDPNNKDTDDDGIYDGLEIELGFDPKEKDSNNNGILDGDESAEYLYKIEEYQKGDIVNIEINGKFISKHIDGISIINMDGMNVMTSKETPGYIDVPYLLKIPNGSNDVSVKFNYDKTNIEEGANPTIYRLDKEKNTLIEVEGQDKSSEGYVTLNLNNDLKKDIPGNKILDETDYSVNDNFILI